MAGGERVPRQRWRPEAMVAAQLKQLDGVAVTVEGGQLVATVAPGQVSTQTQRLRDVLRQLVSEQSVQDMLALVTWRTT